MSGLRRLLALETFPQPGARVGFLGHAASRLPDGTHAIAAINTRGEWRVTRLFSPEHGFGSTAAAGEEVPHQLHPEWGVPVHSLYGETRSPRMEWLKDLDGMVTDLQDLGVRCYTYASTLQNVLAACAEAGLPVWVLDRESPLRGVVDGPPLNPALRSFVGQVDLPLVYGWGQGGLARFLRATDPRLRGLKLEVLDPLPPDPGETWFPPSPAIVSPAAARLYPLTVWSEAIPEVWVDRGGPRSFQVWAMPDLPAAAVAERLRAQGARVSVVACQTPGGIWPGLEFASDLAPSWRPVTLAVHLLGAIREGLGSARLFRGKGARPEFFDQLMGTSAVREGLEAGLLPQDICAAAGFSFEGPAGFS